MYYTNLPDDKKYGFNLNTADNKKYPEVYYLTENGGKHPFTHIVSGRLLKLGVHKGFSDAGYKCVTMYHESPVYLEKTIKVPTANGVENKTIQYLNPRFKDITGYNYPDQHPVEVVSFVGKT